MADNPKPYTIKERMYSADNYNITWKIPRFRNLMRAGTNINNITSRKTVVEVPDSKFQLKLRVFGNNNEWIEVYYASPKTVILKITCSISFIKTINEISEDYHTVESKQWQLCAALKPFTTSNCDDVSLIINFNLSVSLNARVDCLNTKKHQLSDDFGNLLSDGSYSDVTVKSAEGDEFRVHKNVLAIRSKVLKAHFEHNTIESTTNIVKTTWETDVLRDLLAFIYTDNVSSVDNDPAKLLAAAEYYELQGLKSICEEALSKRLTIENAIETLQLAELHSANYLKMSTLEFIKDGRTKLITKTEGWKNISIEILKTIYEFITAEKGDILAEAYEYINN